MSQPLWLLVCTKYAEVECINYIHSQCFIYRLTFHLSYPASAALFGVSHERTRTNNELILPISNGSQMQLIPLCHRAPLLTDKSYTHIVGLGLFMGCVDSSKEKKILNFIGLILRSFLVF